MLRVSRNKEKRLRNKVRLFTSLMMACDCTMYCERVTGAAAVGGALLGPARVLMLRREEVGALSFGERQREKEKREGVCVCESEK